MPSFEFTDPDALTFSRDGAQRFRSALDTAALDAVRNALASVPPDQAGVRIHGIAELRPILASSGPVGAVAVAARIDVKGFGPWTVKNGLVHVAPPFGLLKPRCWA